MDRSDGTPSPPPLLKAVGLRKRFPGVQAIGDGRFELKPGEIHALVGENGAGKSTMIKVMTGVHRPDEGELFVDGEPVIFIKPTDSSAAGIVAIYQEFTLVPTLSVAANLFLGREPKRAGLIQPRIECEKAEKVLARLDVKIDLASRVSSLSVSEQQLVEIARALLSDANILIMDEPTAALTPREVAKLFEVLRDLARDGMGIIFVSHRLNEIFEISDRITVMRDGITIDTVKSSETDRGRLIELMVGRPLDDEFPDRTSQPGEVRFSIRNLSGGMVRDISFAARAGEIVGVAGLMGSGRTEMARLITGADRPKAGEIVLDGHPLEITSPRDSIAAGICLLNEDRKHQGLVLCASAIDNFALPNLKKWSGFGLINLKQERSAFGQHTESLAIKISSPEQRAENLSGGNQQKLLVARWLETDSQVIIFDEPTRGIDVGARFEMYTIIRRLAASGKVVILISSELPEILGMCDRVLVMKSGRISGEINDVAHATQEEVMALAV